MSPPEDTFEQLAHLRPEERERLLKVSQLSDRQWQRLTELTDLSEDQWDLLTEGVDLVRSLQVVGKLTKWFVVCLVGIFLGVVALGESAVRFKSFFVGSSK